jgi:hypothetical protein
MDDSVEADIYRETFGFDMSREESDRRHVEDNHALYALLDRADEALAFLDDSIQSVVSELFEKSVIDADDKTYIKDQLNDIIEVVGSAIDLKVRALRSTNNAR